MRIIIDTNIVISASFFSGLPRKIIEAVIKEQFKVCANNEIVEEYDETVAKMIYKGKGHLNYNILKSFMTKIELIDPVSRIAICRDPDDDKFINCAIDAKAIYIVIGDSDLLTIGQYEDVEIITAKDFYDKYFEQ